MLIPTFQLHLADRIESRKACIGKYDGKHPSLTCATSGTKIFIHSPHMTSETDMKLQNQMRYLNINKSINAVCAGALRDDTDEELLMVGTQSDLLAYNVEKNSDHFFKDVADGVNTIVFGRIPSVEKPLAIVGGNCSIQGFDAEGEEPFWTVTGDNVTALTFCDIDSDGQEELVVGSEDFEIRVYKDEEVVSEVSEADKVIGLCHIHDSLYGYALANGTIGIYNKTARAWRVKSKNMVETITGFDLDSDGVCEIISGWGNGKLEVRGDRQGEVIFRDNFSAAISGLLEADYRSDGRDELIVCSLDGEVRGYLPATMEQRGNMMDNNALEEKVLDLTQKKQELMYELNNYETNNAEVAKVGTENTGAVIPANTRVTSLLEMNPSKQCCDLVLQTNNECVIKGLIIFAEQLFDSESLFHYQREPKTTCRVPLQPKKDMPCTMVLKVLVGSRTSNVYHVFEIEYKLPKFAMYVPISRSEAPEPVSSVNFAVNERVNRVNMWMQQSFSAPIEAESTQIDITFVSLRDGKPMWFAMQGDGNVCIKTDNMEVAGEMITDLCAYLGINELESSAEFPYEMEAFRTVLLQVEEYNAVRLKLTAEMADSSNLVKTLVIKAEDARILGNMKLMKRMYTNLYNLNRELIMEHTKRSTNHTELLAALKEVNQMIQKSAKLRVGTAKTRVVAACRNAIKTNNIHSLFKIMKTGDTS